MDESRLDILFRLSMKETRVGGAELEFSKKSTPSVKKTNLVLDGTFSSTTSLDRSISRYVVLENV